MLAAEKVEVPEGVDADAWNAALTAVRSYCGWHIAPSITSTVTLDGNGADTLMLPSLYVQEVSSVEDDGRPVEFRFSRHGMVRKRHGGRFTSHFGGVKVSYLHGYDSLPDDVAAVVLEAATRGVAGSLVAQVGQVRYGGTGQISGAAGFVADRASVLDRYRLEARPV